MVVPQTLKSRRLEHWILNDLDQLVEGRFGTKYPKNGQRFTGQPDCVLVPGLAFDFLGFRLGYGAGYYDAFLIKTKATKVGVGFPLQFCRQPLPTEEHDVALDLLVTEQCYVVSK